MAGGSSPAPEPREARDVLAFGQEVGRVLSDGRIVGRAEPFAKVFPSSRAVKRAVGLMAWGILEDVALDARIDDRGWLVAETSVRRIAANLRLNKDTVTKYLGRLAEHGFVFQEESREVTSGRWEPCRYVLDPSACIERFTLTPTQNRRSVPCPKPSDTVAEPVSDNTGHGDTGHGGFGRSKEDVVEDLEVQRQEQQHRAHARDAASHPADADDNGGVATKAASNGANGPGPSPAAPDRVAGNGDGSAQSGGALVLAGRLQQAGVAGDVAEDLVGRYPPERIGQALTAAKHRRPDNPPGWIVAALANDWDLSAFLAQQRADDARREREHADDAARDQARRDEQAERDRAAGWSAAVSVALDDSRLATAVEAVTAPMAGVERRSVPLARAQLIAWAAAVHTADPDRPLAEALAADLDAASQTAPEVDRDGLPAPPATGHPPDSSARIARHLQHTADRLEPTGSPAARTREQPDHGWEL